LLLLVSLLCIRNISAKRCVIYKLHFHDGDSATFTYGGAGFAAHTVGLVSGNIGLFIKAQNFCWTPSGTGIATCTEFPIDCYYKHLLLLAIRGLLIDESVFDVSIKTPTKRAVKLICRIR
jgi:hypothetical protein